jgi:hypothetical protein
VLRAGDYRAVFTAVDAAGTSTPQALKFNALGR